MSEKGGVPVGTHKIEITAHRYEGGIDPAEFEQLGMMDRPPSKQYIPERYLVLPVDRVVPLSLLALENRQQALALERGR